MHTCDTCARVGSVKISIHDTRSVYFSLLGSDIDESFEARNRSALLALVFVFEFGKLVG